jgi:hypothetical protein
MSVKYELIEIEGIENWGVKLLSGKYSDVVVTYGAVDAIENDDGTATLSYQVSVLSPLEEKSSIEGQEEFKLLTGEVLYDIITTAFDSGDYRLGEDSDDDRNNDTKERTAERGLFKAGYSISEA